jgi:TonB family protein
MTSPAPSAERSHRKPIVASLVLTLGLISNAFAQEPQRDEPQQPKLIRKSGGVLQGSATRRVEPAYPPLAKAAQVSGSVVVEVTIDEEGTVFAARAISGHPLLKDAAVAAARGWRFAPTMLQGVRVKVIGTITFNFVLGEPKELEELEAQVRENPGSAEAHLKLAEAYRDRGRSDEAITEYTAAIRVRPNYATAYYALGLTYERLNRLDDALEAYKQAVSVKAELDSAGNPTFTVADQAYIFMASIYSRTGRHQEALEVLKQAASLYPNLDAVHYYLAENYLEIGDKQSALNEYNAIKEKDGELMERLLKRIEKKP